MKLRIVYFVRTGYHEYATAEQAVKEFDDMARIFGETAEQNAFGGILTVGCQYYHDNPLCSGHADPDEKCS